MCCVMKSACLASAFGASLQEFLSTQPTQFLFVLNWNLARRDVARNVSKAQQAPVEGMGQRVGLAVRMRKHEHPSCRPEFFGGKGLRRTAARDFRRAGVSEGESMQLCGWETRSMFDRYNVIDEADLARAVAKRLGMARLRHALSLPPRTQHQ